MRTALVTGATSGIGRAAALALGDAGWWVLACGRDPVRGAEVAAELAGRAGGEFAAGDLTDVGAAQRLVDRAVAATGRLDLVVYSAGTHFLASVEETDPDDYDRLMATNLRGAVLLARAAVPAMRASDGGVVVNVASEAGLVAGLVVVERLPHGEIQLVEIAAGGHFAMHASPDIAFCQVVRGRGKLGLPGGTEISYEAPELYVFHPGALHDWHDVEEDTLLSVCLVRAG